MLVVDRPGLFPFWRGENIHARETAALTALGYLQGLAGAIAAADLRFRSCGDEKVTSRLIDPTYREPARVS
jgi:hypothetical protein